MSPKERKTIHNGLLEQGAEVVRDGKRGTLYKLPAGDRWMLPYGTSDNKARLAMRAEIRRLGLHWPLDPDEDTRKKETTTSTATVERPMLDHKVIPPAVQGARDEGWKPREEQFRRIEPYLRGTATPFWTDDALARIKAAGVMGWASSASMQRLQAMLDFAGFRVIESKKNRSGNSYRWGRDDRQPWPTEFAPRVTGIAAVKQAAKLAPDDADAPEEQPQPYEEVATVEVVTVQTEAGPEQFVTEAVPQGNTEEETALGLAEEYEQRALRLQRQLDVQARAFKQDIEEANTRAQRLLRRQAELEGMVHQRDRLIAKTVSERDEAQHLLTEQGAVAPAEDYRNLLARNAALEDQLERAEQDLKDARIELRNRPTVNDQDGWWALEGSSQTVNDLIASASAFGLEVRLQARQSRKDA